MTDLLETLDVKEPCSEPWEGMKGDARARHCERCNLSVYNLSEMTHAEAQAVLRSQDPPCVRFIRRADGTVLTKDCRTAAGPSSFGGLRSPWRDEVSVSLFEGPWAVSQGLAEGLKKNGINVLWVSRDARTFLDGMKQAPPQVAILDLEPDNAVMGCTAAEGLNLLREARKLRPEARMLVVASKSSPELVSQCYVEGAANVLPREHVDAGTIPMSVRMLVTRYEGVMGMMKPPQSFSIPPSFTPREREVLACVAGGADNRKIAAHLRLTERTVKSHVSRLYQKLGADNRTQLALRAVHLGVRPPPDL